MELRWQELSLEVNVTVSHPFGGSIGGGVKKHWQIGQLSDEVIQSP